MQYSQAGNWTARGRGSVESSRKQDGWKVTFKGNTTVLGSRGHSSKGVDYDQAQKLITGGNCATD